MYSTQPLKKNSKLSMHSIFIKKNECLITCENWPCSLHFPFHTDNFAMFIYSFNYGDLSIQSAVMHNKLSPLSLRMFKDTSGKSNKVH